VFSAGVGSSRQQIVQLPDDANVVVLPEKRRGPVRVKQTTRKGRTRLSPITFPVATPRADAEVP